MDKPIYSKSKLVFWHDSLWRSYHAVIISLLLFASHLKKNHHGEVGNMCWCIRHGQFIYEQDHFTYWFFLYDFTYTTLRFFFLFYPSLSVYVHIHLYVRVYSLALDSCFLFSLIQRWASQVIFDLTWLEFFWKWVDLTWGLDWNNKSSQVKKYIT